MKKALPEKAEFFYIICIIFTRDGKYFFCPILCIFFLQNSKRCVNLPVESLRISIIIKKYGINTVFRR